MEDRLGAGRSAITFDVQEFGRPDTVEQAEAYVRRGADFVGAEIPPNAVVSAGFEIPQGTGSQ